MLGLLFFVVVVLLFFLGGGGDCINRQPERRNGSREWRVNWRELRGERMERGKEQLRAFCIAMQYCEALCKFFDG